MASVVVGIKLSAADVVQLFYRLFPNQILDCRLYVQRKLQNQVTDPEAVNLTSMEFIMDQDELFTKFHKDFVICPYTESSEFAVGICIADEEDDHNLSCPFHMIKDTFEACKRLFTTFQLQTEPVLLFVV